jgi:hypothetical protein
VFAQVLQEQRLVENAIGEVRTSKLQPASIPLRLVAVGLDERLALLATVERRVASPETDYSSKRKVTHLKSVNTGAFIRTHGTLHEILGTNRHLRAYS